MTFTRLLRLVPAALLVLFALQGAASAQFKCQPDWTRNQQKRCCTKEYGCLCYPGGTFSTTPCDRPAPQASSHDKAIEGLKARIREFQGHSQMTNNLIRDLNDLARKSTMGDKPSSKAGNFVSRLAGVGQCNRHFYNNSDNWWGLGMWYAGTCEGEMVPNSQMGNNHYACLIGPHSSTIIHYANYGDEPDGGKIAVASGGYSTIFNLRTVGCHIEPNDIPARARKALAGMINLNDPADGDIDVRNQPTF
jgi:hypothetical protein